MDISIKEVLSKPDAEILRSGLFVKMIVKEWHRLSGEEPSACDCQLKNYLRFVRLKYEYNKA